MAPLLPTKIRCVLEGHSDEVWDLRIAPCGTLLASASLDGSIKVIIAIIHIYIRISV